MTISSFPTPTPDRTQDPEIFDPAMSAFMAHLPTFVTEANALAVAMNLNDTTDTSVSSVLIGLGAKTFTVSADKSFQPGMYLVVADSAAPSTNSMVVQVTSYSGTALVVSSKSIRGSGTIASWVISLSAAAADIAQDIHAATNKVTPVGADEAGIWDSVSGLLNRISFTNLATYFSGLCTAGWNAATATATTTQNQNTNSLAIASTAYVDRANQISVRQTVKFGPVDANGFSDFGGATGATTVTATGTIYPTAAYGMMDLIGAITDPSWTGLSTNGTMYLYVDIAADGTCTPGVGTLAPVYQWGGTYSTTNGQFTFNIQEMTGKVGNGATAAQAYRVYVGEVVVSGGVVASIIWYALNRRFKAALGTNLNNSNTQIVLNHNLGVDNPTAIFKLRCNAAENGYSIGDVVFGVFNAAGTPIFSLSTDRKLVNFIANIGTLSIAHKTTSAISSITLASWDFVPELNVGW